MIRHTVVFTLHHPPGSAEEQEFLQAARALADIPGVRRFEQLRQVSDKSDFSFGFAMEFEDRTAYRAYDEHPVHSTFVTARWESEVQRFQELDFVAL